MPGASNDPKPNAPLTPEELATRWDHFRKGGQPACPRCEGPMAVAVDATSHAYRMTCVDCGTPSPWFESTPTTGIRLRSGTSSMPAPRTVPPSDD